MSKVSTVEWIREAWEAHGPEWVRDNKHACDGAVGKEVAWSTWDRALRLVREEQELSGKGTPLGDLMQSYDVDTEGKSELYHGIDVSKWSPKRLRVNTWGSESNPNKQVRVEYSPRAEWTPEAFAEKVMALLSAFRPRHPKIKRTSKRTGLTAEIMIPDFHMGARVWGSAAQAREAFLDAIHTLMSPYTPGELGGIIFPIGHDYLNYDNWLLTTTKGTQQDTSDRPDEVIEQAQQGLIEAIDYLAQYADVDVVVIPGNHDWLLSHMLGRILQAWYKAAPHVSIDAALQEWKFRTGAQWLLGMTHGKHPDTKKGLPAERLAQLLPLLAPRQWADSTCREVHTGHYHTASGGEYPRYKDVDGVMVRRVASLADSDEREKALGYMSGKEAELLIFDDRHVVETRSYRP